MKDKKFLSVLLFIFILAQSIWISSLIYRVNNCKKDIVELKDYQRFILDEILISRKTEIKLLDFQNKILDKIDSLKIKE